MAQIRGAPRDPPKAWSCLKYMTNTFAVLVHALFSKKCPFFESLWRLRETICSMRDYKANFTPELCAQITFHMLKDARFFFAVELRVDDIEKICRGEDVTWPTSDLTNVSLQLRGLHVNSLMTDDLLRSGVARPRVSWRTKASGRAVGPENGGTQEVPEVQGAQEALEGHNVGGRVERPTPPLKVAIWMHGTTRACRGLWRVSWDL